jgi:hypothetical protein
MTSGIRKLGAVALISLGAASAARAQEAGWTPVVDGLALFQSDAALNGGGGFSANRQYLRAGALYRNPEGASFGFLLSYGQVQYDFATPGAAPWGDVNDVSFSAPFRFRAGDRANVLIAPSVRWDGENGTGAGAMTYGIFAGVSWEISERLEIGPAFGAFSELGNADVNVFPALLVNWRFADRWRLSTSTGLGASQGPGLSLSYKASDVVDLSLIARSESNRFRLDNVGLAPGGVGEDRSLPVVMALQYQPNPGMTLSVFAGAELDGRLQLENAAGAVISRQSYDPAGLVGVSFRLMF